MTKQELTTELQCTTPAPHLSVHVQALWHTHHNQWEKAHDLVQSLEDSLAALIHGYLHHVEGDHWNGDYWYRKSGFQVPQERDRQWDFILEQVASKK